MGKWAPFVMHSLSSLAWPKQDPPFFSTIDLDLVLCLVPAPHDLEHDEDPVPTLTLTGSTGQS